MILRLKITIIELAIIKMLPRESKMKIQSFAFQNSHHKFFWNDLRKVTINSVNRTVIFFLFSVLVSSSTSAQWTRTNGPEGVAISSLANIDGTIYAGTEVNGVYISTDDGVSWIARNSGIENYGISSIINFQGFIFAGTSGGGVYRSSDGGITWTAPSIGNSLFITSLVANDPYIFAGAGSLGVYRSSDNGVTWEQKLNVFGVGAMCKSGNKIFASSSNYTDYTTDNGETWINVQPLEGAIIFSYYCLGDTIFAGGQTKIYRSTDNGNTFTTITLNLGFSIVNISAITSVGPILYAATSYDGVYKSTDFGSNWTPANGGMGSKDVRALTVTNTTTLIAGTHYVAMYRSTDLGQSWTKSVTGFPAGASILCLLESDSSIYAGTRDGVFRTDDNGDNWVKMGGTNDTTMYSDIWAMCEHDGVIYASMQLYFDATIYKSTDKGTTWIRCSKTGLPAGLSFIKGLEGSGNNLVAGTDEGIYYSPDGGDNWYPTNIQNINVPNLAASGNYVYAAVPSGAGVYRSSDNGVNWTVSLQSTVDYVEVAAIDNYAFAGAFFGGARYSSNYGSTWFQSGGFPTDASVFALGTVSDGMILAGTDLSPNWIYASFNNGGFFAPYSDGLFENASVEAFAVNETYMFAGTDYNGVWRRLRPGVVNTDNQKNAPQEFLLAQNYPNPFNPTTTIQYSIPISGNVKLGVYNSLGEEIATLVNDFKIAGNYEITFDAGNLTSGIYIYRLQATDFIETKKMILLK
jgi:photosystem II stability/assembly factor-like uncharacterized protein